MLAQFSSPHITRKNKHEISDQWSTCVFIGVVRGCVQGHTMGAAMTGSLGGGGEPAEQVAAPAPQQAGIGHSSLDDQSGVCRFELRQFLECSQTQHDLSLCQGFNEALKDCRRAHGM